MPDDNQSYVSPSGLAGLPDWASEAGLTIAHTRDGGLQCGIDIIEVERVRVAIERWGQRFLNRVWTEHEQRICRGRFPELAARFAGKEAVSKALGTGIVGLIWREIEILQDRRGKPLIFLHGAAHDRAESLGFTNMAISLSHTRVIACAMVVATGRNE